MPKTHVPLKPGDLLSDNDPRMQPRVLRVVTVSLDYVYARPDGASSLRAHTRISRARIHADGKARRTGFDLITTKD